MTASKMTSVCFLSLMGAAVVCAAQAQSALKSPDDVHKALATLNRVVGHTQRLLDAKNYARLPHENGELVEGSEALETSIRKEPAPFKARVVPLLKAAVADSRALSTASKSHDDAQLATLHSALATDVKSLIAAFPSEVQPAP